ncbi:MAG: YIP1 family protein [Clostridia bacterium]|nr:YIP1 family protein [Clostridia bacterium]
MSNLKLFFKSLKYKFEDRKNVTVTNGFEKSMLIYPFRLFTHPIETFNDLKYEKKASFRIANTLAVLFVLLRLFEKLFTGYLFNKEDAKSIDMFSVIFIAAGILLVWTLCNWATCTLFDGEGSMGDIWIAVTYSLVPYIIFHSLSIALSYFFTSSEAVFYNFFCVLGTLWTLILVFLGLMVVHQYTVLKTVLSVLGTLLIILCFVFLLMLFVSIFQQMYSFLLNIIREVVVRRL